jgi:uncharacterized protein (TIGR02145 family)
MKTRLKRLTLQLFLFSLWSTVMGQVTIGDGIPPQDFSVLEVSTASTKGGLRLPHLTTAQRNDLAATAAFQAQDHRGDAASPTPGLGLGLTIYNTDTNCVEYWNGYKWISLCLGTADIVLKSPCGDYDPQNPPVETADGIHSGCEYTPEETPACVVSSGKAFEVLLMAGGSYATLTVDPLTSAFTVSFTPNNSSLPRNAVVRVTSNCSGEFKDFVFSQMGATCTGSPDPTLNNNTLELCSGGSVFAHVTNAVASVDYIWTYAGSIIHTGNWLEIKRAGIYTVYTGLLGCGTPATLTVTGNSGSTAPSAIRISATNGGILCLGGNVILTANTTDPVVWYHNGIPHSSASNPLILSGAAMAGEWFAAVTDAGGCVSHSSNVLTLADNTGASIALPVPTATVNEQNLTGALTICKSGTLKLEVTNAASYPAGTQYEWFDNGVSIGKGTNPVIYLVAPNTSKMILSVTASDNSGGCPNTAVSQSTDVTLTAPEITSINNGATNAAICGGTAATLIADRMAGPGNYEWMKDGFTIAGQTNQTLLTAATGKYTVRYKDSNGCWSVVSTSINVIQSASLNMSWNPVPTDVVKGDQVTYTINSAPVAAQYKWSYNTTNPNAVVSLNPIGNGTSAVVQYGATSGVFPSGIQSDVELVVQSVGHPCGDVTLKQTIQVKDGCTTGKSVNLTPNGTITNHTAGKKITFSASTDATNNNSDLKYQWFVDGASQGAASPINTFDYTPASPGTYIVSVRVTNDCTPPANNLTEQATLNVTADPENYTPDGTFKLTGKNCFDVAQSNFNGTCGTQSQRPGDFLDGSRNWDTSKAQWTYTLVPVSGAPAITNLQFVTDDPSVLIKSQTSNIAGKTHTITFDQSVLTKAKGKNKANALTITVYALYEQPAGTKKRVELKINVQDCLCGCGAYVLSASDWRVFMCHNLGADESKDPLVPSKEIHGAKYKFGAKNPTLTMSVDQSNAGAITNWTNTTTYPYQASGDWDMVNNNPCPTGYRVPMLAEWQGVINNNSHVPIGANWNSEANNYSSGRLFGDALFLPAAGHRDNVNGQLNDRGRGGWYWSSTQGGTGNNMVLGSSGATTGSNFRTVGFSVRCIAAE